MNIQELTTKMRIQNRVSELVEQSNTNDIITFDLVSEKIVAEFGQTAIDEAKKQYDFMIEW